jgi:hypothetical protein
LWILFSVVLVGVFAFFYLGAAVSPVTLYQSARPDASTAFYDIHPEQNSTVKLLEYPTRVLVSWADGRFLPFLYHRAGFAASAMLWAVGRSAYGVIQVLSFLPLAYWFGIAEFWLWSVTALWL